MQKPQNPSQPETRKPTTVVDLIKPETEGEFEQENLPGPREYKDIHGHDPDDDGSDAA